jgi:DNA-binding NarL/FixJ family response regulator
MQKMISLIIADDHPVFREGIVATIKDHPLISKIKQAANGNEVIKHLENEIADLVLLDIKMEPMNGIETMEVIKHRFPSVRVIALSMYSEEKYILQLVKLGVSGYLIKNADKEEIINAIEKVISGKTYFTPNVSDVLFEKLMNLTKSIDPVNSQSQYHLDKLHEIIYLMYLEKTTVEIAEILCLSKRTIEEYRVEILKLTNSKNVAGVVKYAIEKGITEDIMVKKRVEKSLGKKKGAGEDGE